MQIKSLRVKNFRALTDVEIPLSSCTVLIGENNSGKSSVLDCIELALGRRWGRQGTGFTEYDLTVLDDSASVSSDTGSTNGEQKPEVETEALPPEASIELLFAESTSGEWPEGITQALFDLVQVDPHSGLHTITLRVTYTYNELEREYRAGWTFVDINGDRLGTSSARRATNTSQFFKYVPVFILSALRDSSEEFSSRSQFWGRLLKAVEITPEQREELDQAVEELNTKLLAADPRISQTVDRLKEIQSVIATGAADDVSIRALPMKVWQILARSEVLLKGDPDAPWLPLSKQGQGVRSLSVVFLFNAFVDRLLKEAYTPFSEPVLALEEPEVHLHPQAARSLWSQISSLRGQKVVASHSPYFLQCVPIRDVRLLRRGREGVRVHYLRDHASVTTLSNERLSQEVADSSTLSWDENGSVLTASSPIDEEQYRRLLRCFTKPEETIHHAQIAELRRRSASIMAPEDVAGLEDWARRTRGEIFFARSWVLCEGQSEIFLLSAVFDSLGYSLDSNGVSLIDYQNNGSPRAFASLARSFGFPWFLLADGDEHGLGVMRSLKAAGFTPSELSVKTLLLPNGLDLEACVCASPLQDLAIQALPEADRSEGTDLSPEKVATKLRDVKPSWARTVGELLRENPDRCADLPQPLVQLAQRVIR